VRAPARMTAKLSVAVTMVKRNIENCRVAI